MITLEIDCSMCGESPPLRLSLEKPKDFNPEWLERKLKGAGWVMQLNGDHIDTYCTKKCAR